MEKKIVGLNTYFKSLEYENFDEYEFSARISLLDYDAVVINAEYLITNYSTSYDSSYQNKPCLSDYNSAQIVEDFKKIEGQIKELLKQGRNVFVLMGNNDNSYILGKNSIQGQEEMQDKQILLESLMHIHFCQ